MSDKYAGHIDQSQESRIGSGFAASLAQEAWTPQAMPKMELSPVSNVLTAAIWGSRPLIRSKKMDPSKKRGDCPSLLNSDFRRSVLSTIRRSRLFGGSGVIQLRFVVAARHLVLGCSPASFLLLARTEVLVFHHFA
jgi:hypothetical protein